MLSPVSGGWAEIEAPRGPNKSGPKSRSCSSTEPERVPSASSSVCVLCALLEKVDLFFFTFFLQRHVILYFYTRILGKLFKSQVSEHKQIVEKSAEQLALFQYFKAPIKIGAFRPEILVLCKQIVE